MVGSAATAVCLLAGIRLLWGLSAERRQVAAAAAGYRDASDQPVIDQANQWFRGTRAGRVVQRELELAGIDQRPIVVAFAVVGIGAVAAYVLWSALAPVFGVLGLGVGVLAVRAYIRRAKNPEDEIVVLLNFTPETWNGYRIGVPRSGYYREIFNSDSEYYGGSNKGNAGGLPASPRPSHGHPQSLELTVPPLSAVLLKREN